MRELPLSLLFLLLAFLILLSAFFSGSETALMTLNRYRLHYLATQKKQRTAILAHRLLQRPDRLIGLILLGNNFVNILASSIATVIAIRLWGDSGIAIAAGMLTFVILIFSEVTPKTLAAIHPERLAFPAAWVYTPLLKAVYPLVWLINIMANFLLKTLFKVHPDNIADQPLKPEELRTVVLEAGNLIPKQHKKMLLSVLDLEKITVEDIMIPYNEISAIDISDTLEELLDKINHIPYTRIPVYEESIDNIIGILHLKKALKILNQPNLTKDKIREIMRPPYFIHEHTPLTQQLLDFQKAKRRIALVVNEYGDLMGLATLEDILEEIVGEFTTDPSTAIQEIQAQTDGSYLVDGSIHIRELNRYMNWDLPIHKAKTLNGLILEHLQDIPKAGISLRLSGYPIEILQTQQNVVKLVKFYPHLRKKPPEIEN